MSTLPPFKLNAIQRRCLEHLDAMRAAGKPVRVLVTRESALRSAVMKRPNEGTR